MKHFRIQSLAVHQYGRKLPVGDYYGCCRHNLRAPSSLELYGHADHERDMGRWRVYSIGNGILNSVRRLDSTCCWRFDG
jgi:hypothetical protein